MDVRKRFKFLHKIYIFCGAMACLFILWCTVGFPRSLLEYKFLATLESILLSAPTEISLTALMPTNWETVCGSHGYDGEIYLTKYNKKFPTAGQMQDGAWGLTFIKSDGTYDQISSSCSRGSYISFSANRCLTRDKSILHRLPKTENSVCVYFEAVH